jgi:adenylate cyclase
MRYNFSCILAGYLGETDEALSLLQSTLSIAGEFQVRIAETDPDLDPIRDEPKFKAMLAAAKKRLGIEEKVPAS